MLFFSEESKGLPFNPLNPMGQNTSSRKCVPLTRRGGIPVFAKVCQKPEEPVYRLM